MVKYKFQIDKNANFIYWLQSIVDWRWSFDKRESEYWNKIIGDFNSEEKLAIKKFKKLLTTNKTFGGYFGVWKLYDGQNIDESTIQNQVQLIKNTLDNKFEIIWKQEYPKLFEWQHALENYDFFGLSPLFDSLRVFFASDANDEIKVNLCLSIPVLSPAGHAKKQFKNMFMLNVSGLPVASLKLALNSLVHETVHLINDESNKNILLKKTFSRLLITKKKGGIKKIINKLLCIVGVKKEIPTWSYLSTESIIWSIAGAGLPLNYLNSRFLPNANDRQWNKKSKSIYAKIAQVAETIQPITNTYLDSRLEMDEKYCDEVAMAWKNIKLT